MSHNGETGEWRELDEEQPTLSSKPQDATMNTYSTQEHGAPAHEEAYEGECAEHFAQEFHCLQHYSADIKAQVVPQQAFEEEAPQEYPKETDNNYDAPQHAHEVVGPGSAHARSMPAPHAAAAPPSAIVKPRTRHVKSVARWEAVGYDPRDGSDDEFEQSTCMAPVYEDEGEEGNEDASVFKHGEPDFKGEIMSCFDEPNLLYRIIDPKTKTWAFYNDSLQYEMHVQFIFGKHSKLQPLENTTLRQNEEGQYVTFNKNGWWRSVVVDSYLPVSGGKLKYAKSATDPAEIWPAILEKAYAKLHGSYGRICSGDPLHALQDMTGFSTMRFDESLTDDKASDQLFSDLVHGIAAGYTVICSTPGRGPHDKDQELCEMYAQVGLVTGCAYTILEAKYIESKELRMVKVRNVWGHSVEWSGNWGNDDTKWDANPDIAEECNFQKAADGMFWMSWKDARKYFNGGGVCFTHQAAYDYRMNCVFTEGVPSAVLEIEVQSPTCFTFVISQDDKRCQVNASEYKPVMISIAEPVEGEMYKVVMNSSANGARPTSDKWTFLQARDVSLIHELDAGKYIVVPRIMPSDDPVEPVPYVLGMICSKEVGNGDVSVKFKRLDAGNRVFENFPKFEPELMEVEQPVQYQKRAPGEAFPMTQMGEELM
ncbi:putative calpain-like cysteine peptidase [Leishmania mexicana MHOM/GT/2001/U1103]|uniref:Calpain-like cysteine peptidase n=1 Tax=Leishmania mexicana (strain MHOM/GT/2001/U1103) TaxID=929439 RepID=E9AUQ8_LEIMU|nr:putative calpain-like cysteine peptidase [Leishmania mexicana MHOM/GT/2001/U1103]CBZ26688.1 putative calpain-like cysteine peptidase [Leishmania mexicana MHOM/GT/2001/U1103]